MKADKSGFTLIEALLILLILLIVGSIGLYILRSSHATDKTLQAAAHNQKTSPPVTRSYLLTGSVSEGPMSPGPCRSNQSCSDAPVINHSMIIYNMAGTIVTSAKTDSNGVYKVRMQPGKYTIKLEPAVGVSENSFTVTVSTKSATFNISIDTGLR